MSSSSASEPSGTFDAYAHPRSLPAHMAYMFTPYFERVVLAKRPSITRDMCIRVVKNPIRVETQTDQETVRS